MRLAVFQYVHILNKNTSLVRIEIGPKSIVTEAHEMIVTGNDPVDFIVLKPNTYIRIKNPVIRDSHGELVRDKNEQIKVAFGEEEIRTDDQFPDPFPLFPNEEIIKRDALPIVEKDCVINLRAARDFTEKSGTVKRAGEEWQIKGPLIYIPQIQVEIVSIQHSILVSKNNALQLKAKRTFVDTEGTKRIAGEEWLMAKEGQYILGLDEELIQEVKGIILTNQTAICLTAKRTFVDKYGKKRKAGEQWNVTNELASVHVCEPSEVVLAVIGKTVLRTDEYCYILNPRINDVKYLGRKILIIGPTAFFLKPGEEIDGGIKKKYILSDTEALLVQANEVFEDEDKARKVPGQQWLIKGPICYVPPTQVDILEKRNAIVLDKTEGIYVRNKKTGEIRAQIGKTYMLSEDEELSDKHCTQIVDELLSLHYGKPRESKYKLITYKCPFNATMQIYDYKNKKSRVIFGPELAYLQPNEQFTVTYLSGKIPKRHGQVKTLHLLLGPKFSTDIITVESCDHAKLEIKLSYNWRFKVDKDNPEKLFNAQDFVGDLCKSMSSRIRGVVAGVHFDEFHKCSVANIKKAVFGLNKETKEINEAFFFENNGLEVFNIDIQHIEPTDKNTKTSLDKTVTQAIEITTKIQEQEARRQADKIEQEEKGKLDRLILENQTKVEEAKKSLLQLKADSNAVKMKGQAIAEAKAKVTSEEILAKAKVRNAELAAEAKTIREVSQIAYQKEKNLIELNHSKAEAALAVKFGKESADIQAMKFGSIMKSIGKETLIEIASSGPEMKSKMLEGLGLKGYMIMGSENPINLFSTAEGMIQRNPT